MQLNASTQSLETLLRLVSPVATSDVDPSSIDWQEVDLIARHTHVTVPLWMRLRNSSLVDSMPADVVFNLRRTFHESVQRSWLLRSMFIKVARQLNACQQVPIALKGSAYLLDPPLRDIARRYMHDLDIMASDPHASQRCLAMDGYDVLEDKIAAGGHHLPALKNRSTGLEVEIHTRPFWTADEPMENLFAADLVPMEVAGASFLVPSRACRIVTTVVHAQMSDWSFGGGFFNPRYLLECAEYAVTWDASDWERAEAILNCNNLAYGNFRYLMKAFLGVVPPTARNCRLVDTIQYRRVMRRRKVIYTDGLWQRGLGKLAMCKDNARRRFGHLIGWRSVSPSLAQKRMQHS